MLKFYYSGAPNPTKVALFLEETGTPYDPIPIDTRKGEQHKPEFLAINPNAKLSAIVDGDVKVFDSSAILLYLAEKLASSSLSKPTRPVANYCRGCSLSRQV
jgi:GSH-dependent disulfide-bond oxidoreductase